MLEFGNCWTSGNVAVYQNDDELDDVGAESEDQVEFDFEDGDVLKITGDETAIIQFNDLKIWSNNDSHKTDDVVCDANSHVNNLKGSKSEYVSGWTFNSITRGPWNKDSEATGYECSKASWYGWDHPGDASISTTLHGTGKAILEFGNCQNAGNVNAYLNDKELSCLGARMVDQVEFDFQDGDVLKITEEYGIIQFNGLKFISCSSGKNLST